MSLILILLFFNISIAEFFETNESCEIKFFLLEKSSYREFQLTNDSVLNFNSKLQTRIIIHGYLGSSEEHFVMSMVTAYTKRGEFNNIIVDWRTYAKSLNYFNAVRAVKYVGLLTSKFMTFLNEKLYVPFKNMYLVGHSLGAHICGYAGKLVRTKKIPVIFGLDPASIGFIKSNTSERLSDTDANYVQVIVTNPGALGLSRPIGTATFYINYGHRQPMCHINKLIPYINICSHFRSYEFFSESISTNDNKFWGKKCLNYIEILYFNYCTIYGAPALMGGEPAIISAPGVYSVLTNRESPYAMG